MTSQISTMIPMTQQADADKLSLPRKVETCHLLTARVIAIKQRLVERYRAAGLPMALIREAIAAAEADA